jgi:hypothetical protein
MSWCTAAEVRELISIARLRSDVDATTRKAADLRFIDICTGAINAGDVLLQVATEDSTPPGLRLNAVFAAHPLLTREGWCEGGQFSDRSAVTQLLLERTALSAFDVSAKINGELLRSLAVIVALEFPTVEWQQWIQARAYAFAAGNLTSVAQLRAVVNESYRNYALWAFLASDLTGFLLQAEQLITPPRRTLVLHIFLELMRKRPRPSPGYEIATADNCVLLSATMRSFIMSALVARVEEARVGGVSHAGVVEECTVTFAIASRLVANVETATDVYRCSTFFLQQLQDVAARGAMDGVLVAFTEELLECLLSTLQLFPEVASSDVQAEALLICLIHFMIPAVESEHIDAAQLSTELLEYFMDDEAVPLGCGSGDVAHLAGAVLELFLEHNPGQRCAAIATLNTILRSTPNIRGTLAEAVALALRSVSRVYEAADAVVVDSLDAATQTELLTQISQLLLCTTEAHARTMVMDAMTHCFYRSGNEVLCRQLVRLLQQLYVSATSSSDDGCAACVQCVCVYEAGRLAEEARSQPWCGSLLSSEWMGLAVRGLPTGDTFGVFCSASTLCTLLYVSPSCAQEYLCANAEVWERGLRQLCVHSTVRGVAALLTLTLKHIARISTAATTSPHECPLVACSCATVLRFCQQPSPSRHLVLRSMVDFVAAHTRVLVRGGGCSTCAQHLAGLTVPLLTEELSTELLQDEPSCRCFTVAVTLQCVAFGAGQASTLPTMCTALLRALQHAVQHSYSSQTISSVCGHLALLMTLQPALLDEVPPHVLRALFTANVDLVDKRKGLSYGGVGFLLSLFFMRHPRALLQVATVTAPELHNEAPLLIQRAFGWWLSLAPFMDTLQFPYFTAACCRVVDVLMAEAVGSGSLAAPLAFTRLFLLPSLHIKKLPPRPLTSATVLQHLSLAWADLERRYSITSKPQVLEKELQSYAAGLDQHYSAVCGDPFVGSSAAAVLAATSAETIQSFLRYVGDRDGGDALNAARRYLADVAR